MNLKELNHSVAPLQKKARMYLFIALIIGLGLFFLFSPSFRFFPGSLFFLFILFALTLFPLVFGYNRAKVRYANAVKVQVSKALFEPLFEQFQFDPNQGFDYQTIRSLDILPTGDRFTSNDFMSGRFHGVLFSRADVLTTTTHRDSKGHTHTRTNFKGQVYAFDFFKKTNAYLRIRDRSASRFGRGRKVDGSKQIKFEDSTFNDMFRCYSNDDHEAFYLFTPQFMQTLIDFRNNLNNDFSLVIHDSMLYIAIYSNRDSFEPSVWSKLDESYLNRAHQDVEIISTLIDKLDLKNTLFK